MTPRAWRHGTTDPAASVDLTRLLDELDPPTRDPLAPVCWRCSAVSIEQLPYVTCEQLGCEAVA